MVNAWHVQHRRKQFSIGVLVCAVGVTIAGVLALLDPNTEGFLALAVLLLAAEGVLLWRVRQESMEDDWEGVLVRANRE